LFLPLDSEYAWLCAITGSWALCPSLKDGSLEKKAPVSVDQNFLLFASVPALGYCTQNNVELSQPICPLL
jgi:hypothetical protein